MSEFVAQSAIRDDVAFYTVHSVGSPVGAKDPDRCGILPDYIRGSICYRVCGEIPAGREPGRVEFFSRPSHQGEETPWTPCPEAGCEGSGLEFHREDSRICGVFKLWKGDGSHRDLMMKVHLQ